MYLHFSKNIFKVSFGVSSHFQNLVSLSQKHVFIFKVGFGMSFHFQNVVPYPMSIPESRVGQIYFWKKMPCLQMAFYFFVSYATPLHYPTLPQIFGSSAGTDVGTLEISPRPLSLDYSQSQWNWDNLIKEIWNIKIQFNIQNSISLFHQLIRSKGTKYTVRLANIL